MALNSEEPEGWIGPDFHALLSFLLAAQFN